MMNQSWPIGEPDVTILTNQEAILDLAPVLRAFAERTGQPGTMHWLSYFLEKGVAGRRMPLLVLLLDPRKHRGSSLQVDDLLASALFFEYQIFGIGTGAYTTGDAVGFNSIIAPLAERTRAAGIALRVLVQRGAQVALATYEGQRAAQPWAVLSSSSKLHAASRQRHVERSMKLQPTMDATLAQMGKHTRANLRYYRRRLEKRMDVVFIPDAGSLLIDADLEAINRAALNPVSPKEFVRRVRSASDSPDSFLCGLRAPDGTWLSLVGGWRQGGLTVLHWQMNTAGYEKHSLGTVMRHFFLEAEISNGAKEFTIHGGTPHSMHHSFDTQPIADLIVRRDGLHATVLCTLAHLFAKPRWPFRRANFFASTLLDRSLEWESSDSGGKVIDGLNGLDPLETRRYSSAA